MAESSAVVFRGSGKKLTGCLFIGALTLQLLFVRFNEIYALRTEKRGIQEQLAEMSTTDPSQAL